MQVTEEELRILIADLGHKLANWMYNKEVCNNKLVRETVRRMTEFAAELPDGAR